MSYIFLYVHMFIFVFINIDNSNEIDNIKTIVYEIESNNHDDKYGKL
jgi:hypothetical protein